MKIIKYQKKANGQYQIILENNQTITVTEDVILKHKLLYKQDIDPSIIETLQKDNYHCDAYNKAVKYISVRLRSINEIKEYLKRKEYSEEVIDEVLDRLIKNRLLDDEVFTKAFIKDKLNFTTMGPYRITEELKKHHIDSQIIARNIALIEDDIIEAKINKQIQKLMKSNKQKPNLRNKIYNNLLSLGYSTSSIVTNLNKYDF